MDVQRTWSSGFLVAVLIATLGACSRQEVKPTEKRPTTIVVAGHLYALLVRDHTDGVVPPRDDRALESFAEAIRRDRPDAVFLLGDSTKDGGDAEWDRVQRAFEPSKAPIHLLAGNHDLRAPEVFDRRGGVRNAIFDIGGRRLITLDCKCVYEDSDLEFLKQALETPDGRKPIILMHYCMIDWRDAQPGQDPREDYPGVSNWNRAVVPIIAGRVGCVISGDHVTGGPRRRRQAHGDAVIDYLLCSFGFGGSAAGPGEGAALYLEIKIDDERLEVIPRSLPLPLADDWYLDPTRTERWTLREIDDRGFLWTPPGFAPEKLGAWCHEELGLHLSLERRPWPTGRSFAGLQKELAAALAEEHRGLRSLVGGDLEIVHHRARYEVLEVGGRRLFFVLLALGEEYWVFSGERTGADADGLDWPKILLAVVSTIKLR